MSARRSQRIHRRRTVGSRASTVPGSASADDLHDAASADLVTVDVVVVTAVGEQRVRLTTRTTDAAADRRDRVERFLCRYLNWAVVTAPVRDRHLRVRPLWVGCRFCPHTAG
jgi:hypothetical protein